ncbi:MAG TPA: hypothetical protein ENJ18_00705 [Nannocystis exedens]|nr:hypothetical protein [Nannocystis exedens]
MGPDSDHARKSRKSRFHALDDLERRYLRLAQGHAKEKPPDPPCFIEGQPIRAGYRLISRPGEPVRIEPSFACALAADLAKPDLCRLFDHLWGVDYALWKKLPTHSSAELAEHWQRSLGRRLVRDPGLLKDLRRANSRTEFDLEELWAASGAEVPLDRDNDSVHSRWLDLHASLPGEAMSHWVPKRGPEDAATAFARLERGSPYSLRGASIGWLLNRAVDRRRIDLAGVRQDLREILPARLALALQDEVDRPRDQEHFAARLEEATLRHAAWIIEKERHNDSSNDNNNNKPGRILGAWHVARWIHGCLIRSPFTASDDERLHADLVALLPKEDPPLKPDDDPLHPGRFGGGGEHGLRIEDVALVSGVWVHHNRSGRRLSPTPTPLVQALRKLAERCLRTGERDAEASFARAHSNELGWTAPHFAPPWLARWLLTEWHLPWLARVHDEVVSEYLETLETLAEDPRFEWLAYVWRSEGDELSEAQRARALHAWRSLVRSPEVSPQAVASMATGLLRELTPSDRQGALSHLEKAASEWRPFLWDAWVEAALRHDLMALAEQGLAGLAELTETQDQDRQARLNAALFLLRRAAALRGHDLGTKVLEQLQQIAKEPPFSDHHGLQRELRRLGVR